MASTTHLEALVHDIENFHAGIAQPLASKKKVLNVDDQTNNFHAGELDSCSNNFHAGAHHTSQSQNFHAGLDEASQAHNFHAGSGTNFHAGMKNAGTGENNFHAGDSNFHAGDNFHAGVKNFHAGNNNFHAGENNFHAGESNFHAGDSNFHAGVKNFHAGDNNFHAGSKNFHAGENNFHAGSENFHAGNFHAGTSHGGGNNFHAGSDNFHAGKNNFHAGNFHAGKNNFHAGNFHAGLENSHAENIHAGTGVSTARAEQVGTRGRTVIDTSVRFFTNLSTAEVAFNYVERPAHGRFNNLQSQDYQIQVSDIASSPTTFDIEQHGFACLPEALPVLNRYDWTNDDDIRSGLYPKITDLLTTRLRAKKVVLFDHTIRVQGGNRAPVTQAHIDQTPASAMARVWRHLPPAEAMNMKDRVRIVNIWLPINGKVARDPLAFVDSTTLDDADLTAVEHRYPTWTGETYVVKHNPNQKWHVWGGMEDGDALLLCCYDNQAGVRCAHAAISDPRSPADAKTRESIEVRALVLG